MKKQQLCLLIMVILSLPTLRALAQEDSTKNEVTEGRSQLRLGLTGYARSYSNLGIEIEYERYISPHWSVELNLFGNLKIDDDYRIRSGYQATNQFRFDDLKDEVIGGLAFNYYLKKGSRSGHYFSISANYLFGFYSRKEYTIDLQTRNVTENGKRLFGSNPVPSISYGYRKKFNSGLFIEGRVGVFRDRSTIQGKWAREAKLTVGWVIPFKKKR